MQIIQVPSLEIFSLALQDMLCILCLFSEIYFPLLLKILMSLKYEYYGICVENSYRPVASGVT